MSSRPTGVGESRSLVERRSVCSSLHGRPVRKIEEKKENASTNHFLGLVSHVYKGKTPLDIFPALAVFLQIINILQREISNAGQPGTSVRHSCQKQGEKRESLGVSRGARTSKRVQHHVLSLPYHEPARCLHIVCVFYKEDKCCTLCSLT